MPEPDLLQLFARPLHDAGLRYLIGGSLGAMLYSEPRLTLDADIAVALPSASLNRLHGCFDPDQFYVPPMEVLRLECDRECRGHFNIIHAPTGMKADFYPLLRDPIFGWAWSKKKTVPYDHGDIYFAPVEYILIWKTIYYEEGGSEKHIRDIRRIIELSADLIDMAFLREELDKRGLQSTFDKITYLS